MVDEPIREDETRATLTLPILALAALAVEQAERYAATIRAISAASN